MSSTTYDIPSPNLQALQLLRSRCHAGMLPAYWGYDCFQTFQYPEGARLPWLTPLAQLLCFAPALSPELSALPESARDLYQAAYFMFSCGPRALDDFHETPEASALLLQLQQHPGQLLDAQGMVLLPFLEACPPDHALFQPLVLDEVPHYDLRYIAFHYLRLHALCRRDPQAAQLQQALQALPASRAQDNAYLCYLLFASEYRIYVRASGQAADWEAFKAQDPTYTPEQALQEQAHQALAPVQEHDGPEYQSFELDAMEERAVGGDLDSAFELAEYYARQPEKLDEADFWLERAAQGGHLQACYMLGLRLQSMQPPRWDKARPWLERAAEGGDAHAQHELAMLYLEEEYSGRDEAMASYWCLRSADQGYDRACYSMGMLYLQGLGVPEDEEQALRYFQKAQGLPDAERQLGLYYAYGPEEDWEQAVYHLRKAAEEGDLDAQYRMGVAYEYGYGVQPDAPEAARWYQLAANQRHPQALLALSLCRFNGKGIEQDSRQGMLLQEQSAWMGDAVAQYNMGLSFLQGDGVPMDETQGFYWMLQAAQQGHALAQGQVGMLYVEEQGPCYQPEQGVYWLEQASEAGEIMAQAVLGEIYLMGILLPKDEDKGMELLKHSAQQGYAPAQYVLGMYYLEEERLAPELAVRWLQQAAQQGHADAQAELGGLYRHGLGVGPEPQMAFRWWTRALGDGLQGEMRGIVCNELGCLLQYELQEGTEAERLEQAAAYFAEGATLGNAEAQNNLGAMFALGVGREVDLAQAQHYYLQAARQGHAMAQYNLAGIFLKQRDWVSALHWYQQAAAQGDEDAQRKARRLKRHLPLWWQVTRVAVKEWWGRNFGR